MASSDAVATVRTRGRKLLTDLTSRSSWVDVTGRPSTDGLNIVWLDLISVVEAVRCDKWLLLIACLIVDFIGVLSYVILLLGEVVDLWWAPICGFFLQYMFGSMLMSSFGVIEEILPLTDLVPTATICWCITHLERLERLRTALGVQRHSLTEAEAKSD